MSCWNCLDGVWSELVSFFKPQVYYQLDVLLLGFKNAGKTSFVQALSGGNSQIDTVPTLSMKVSTVKLAANMPRDTLLETTALLESSSLHTRRQVRIYTGPSPKQSPRLEGQECALEDGSSETDNSTQPQLVLKLYDLSGQQKKRHEWKDFMDCHGGKMNYIVYIVDISDSLTLDESVNKLREILRYDSEGIKVPFVIIFNKMDLVDDLEVVIRESEGRQNQKSGGSENSIKVSDRATKVKRSDSMSSETARGHRRASSNNSIHHRRARILLEGTGYHRLLMDYLGILSRGHRLYLGEVELKVDVGLFALSLRQEGNEMVDDLGDVVRWMRAIPVSEVRPRSQ
ncbi:DEKNAAC105455 [Brettanomyces naardenensis]|uniref:DEKNAAC105455 n=1 Tax=Brettanomyces naardenensis TaxID=13370 RepID=A0A448YTI7_BRENA|nr:DEKNAAC105455 [Brettanomyces naardenensis]